MAAEAGRLVPIVDVDAIVDMYPGATVHVLANCGHFAHLEWSRLTVDAIASLLADPV